MRSRFQWIWPWLLVIGWCFQGCDFKADGDDAGVIYRYRGDLQNSGVMRGQAAVRQISGEKWKFSTGEWIISSPQMVGERIYVGSVSGWFYCLDPAGKEIWKLNANAGGGIYSTPLIRDGVAYFGTMDSRFFAVDIAAGGKEKWRLKLDEEVYASATMVDHTLYFGGVGGTFYAMDAATGAIQWRFDTASKIYSSPAIAENIAYFGTHSGILYAVDLQTGRGACGSSAGE